MTGVVPDTTPPSSLPSDPKAGSAGAEPATYAGAGVDIAAGDRAVDLIRSMVASTTRPEVLGELGGFGGLFGVPVDRYRSPVLVASTDGVGTKAAVARAAGRFDTIGIDLVAMCVDDLVCQGAEPLFLLDYISAGSVAPERMAELVSGVAEGCRQVGAALLGGEMAEHAGLMADDEFDLVGFAVGVVERDSVLGPPRVRADDVLVGLASPGLRCNGYTLARHVLLERASLALDGPAWPGSSSSLADELLRPSVLYSPAVLAALAASGPESGPGSGLGLRAVAHVTGGGIAGNLVRALPEGLVAVVDRSTWTVPRIFSEIRRLGPVDDDEMARVFNLGLGMVLVVAPDRVDDVVAAAVGAGVPAWVAGRVVDGERGVDLVGSFLWDGPASA